MGASQELIGRGAVQDVKGEGDAHIFWEPLPEPWRL